MKEYQMDGLSYQTDGVDIYVNGEKKVQTICDIGGRKYYTFSVYNPDGRTQKHFYVHRFLANALVENKCNGTVVTHINRNTLDNSIDNLDWVTKSQLHYDFPKQYVCEVCKRPMFRKPINGTCSRCKYKQGILDRQKAVLDKNTELAKFYEENKDKIDRKQMILLLKEKGLDFLRIGRLLGISRQRVHQIWQKCLSQS